MAMRDYEEMKDIVIPKEQEEMMNIICDAWEECRTLKNCKECPDRPKEFMRMMMCTSLKYTRKLIEAGYVKQPTVDVQEVRHGKWKYSSDGAAFCTSCKTKTDPRNYGYPYCNMCGARMNEKE